MNDILDLSIIIVSYNVREMVRNCLRSVYARTRNISFETFVVDNASSDGSADMVEQEFPQVKLIRNKENAGFAGANNQAVKIAAGKQLLFLNPDTVVFPNTIAGLVHLMDQSRDIGMAIPGLISKEGTTQQNIWEFPSPWYRLRGFLFRPKILKPDIENGAYWGTGACMIIRKDILIDIGGWDENFFLYREDTDLCLSLQKQGIKYMYYPNIHVCHYGDGCNMKRDKHHIRGGSLMVYADSIYFLKNFGIQGWLVNHAVLTLFFVGGIFSQTCKILLLKESILDFKNGIRRWFDVLGCSFKAFHNYKHNV